MKALIVYDSAFGNTARVAHTVARVVSRYFDTQLLQVDDAGDIELGDIDLLVLGSPTQGGRPTLPIQEYIKFLPPLRGKPVAVFDTRFALTGHGLGLHLLMKTIGFAADKMAAMIAGKGGKLIGKSMGFIVEEKTGPLEHHELELARVWAATLVSQISRRPAIPR